MNKMKSEESKKGEFISSDRCRMLPDLNRENIA